MSFEEEFPSLKGYCATFDDAPCVSTGIMFGALQGEGPVIHQYDVERYCFDKARVKEAIERKIDQENHCDCEVCFALKLLLEELGL